MKKIALVLATLFLLAIQATAPALAKKRIVDDPTGHEPGTIVVDTWEKRLFLVLPDNKAIEYRVAVGKEGYEWSGVAVIGRKSKWPSWTPPTEMIKRKPHLKKFASGMPGGKSNPLGARALYLYQDGRDTLYRIHGTNEPKSIGTASSSGCIRMLNADIIDLYSRVHSGTAVVVWN